MTDIVERLRKLPRQYREIEEAAAEIERLRTVLEFYADNYIDGGSKARMALAAFGHKTSGSRSEIKRKAQR